MLNFFFTPKLKKLKTKQKIFLQLLQNLNNKIALCHQSEIVLNLLWITLAQIIVQRAFRVFFIWAPAVAAIMPWY